MRTVATSLLLILPGTYSASKAAVSSLSDTLRVELAPFGVKVITLVTGTVQTHFFDNAVPTELPRGE